jgi:hypothetical protein
MGVNFKIGAMGGASGQCDSQFGPGRARGL